MAATDSTAGAARLLAQIHALQNEIQFQEVSEPSPDLRVRLDAENRLLNELIKDTETRLSLTAASSFEGAIAQVMLARSDAEVLASWAPEHLAFIIERIERCLYSALHFLIEQSGVDPSGVGGRAYLPPLSPFNRPFAQAA